MAKVLRWWLFVAMGFYLSCLLTVLPLPVEYQWFRPQWVLMLVLFCQLNKPDLFNPAIAGLMGLLLDSLLGVRLGEHALIFTVICYVTALLRPRFLLRPLWQQIGKIFLLICLGQIFILWFHAFDGQNPKTLWYWMSSVMSCIAWPGFIFLLQALSLLFKVSPSPRTI